MAFHFNIAREDLLKAAGSQQNITSKKGTLAILSNILVEVEQDHIVFTGTDLDIGLKQSIPAEVFEKGVLTLPAKKLFEVARESGSPTISFQEEEKNWVKITAGSSVYRLAGMVSDEFPQFPDYNQEAMVEIDSAVMNDLIDKTIFSIAQDKENMFTLTAALFKKIEEGDTKFLQMISSDGHRLSIMKKEVDESIDRLQLNPVTLIPRRGVQEIRKFCEDRDTFQIGIEEKQVVLQSDDSLLIIRLLEGDFPDFQALLDVLTNENIIRINRLGFLESLKRINLFTEDLFHAIKMEVEENKIILTSQNADFGSAKDELDVEYTGDPLTLGFNCRYFIDTLQVMEGEIIEACINSNESPCLISSDDDKGFLSIIMPMKL
ncbi:MAG: DNA polymerase III subunit beta [Desulfobulbaceae bacterium]|nr:DNA polymerase III subunit beta [Desulfobulbaceae bacterium]